MQYTITRTCGHQTSETLYGKHTERDRKLAWLKSQPCLPCQRETESQRAATEATVNGLPALVGSEKQIGWATTIRADLLGAVDALIAKDREAGEHAVADGRFSRADVDAGNAQVAAVVQTIRNQTSAGWWIDNRGRPAQAILREAAR